jgi:hypothetical protein
VVVTLRDDLDYAYVESWMARQGLLAIWKELLDTIQPG